MTEPETIHAISNIKIEAFKRRLAPKNDMDINLISIDDIKSSLDTRYGEIFIYWLVKRTNDNKKTYEDNILFTNKGKVTRIQGYIDQSIKGEFYCEEIIECDLDISIPDSVVAEIQKLTQVSDETLVYQFTSYECGTNQVKKYQKYSNNYYRLIREKLVDYKKIVELTATKDKEIQEIKTKYDELLTQKEALTLESNDRKRKAEELSTLIEQNKEYIDLGNKHRKLMTMNALIKEYETNFNDMKERVDGNFNKLTEFVGQIPIHE